MDTKIKNIPNKDRAFISELLTENNFLKNEIALLKEQLKLFLRRKYSSNADEIHPGMRLLFK